MQPLLTLSAHARRAGTSAGLVLALGAVLAGPAPAATTPAAAPADARAAAPERITPEVAAAQGAVTAVVVKSWEGCSSNQLAWDDLNANWSNYGTRRIHVDYADPQLCGSGAITYEALVASGAQTVILSDPAGGNIAWTAAEADALRRYAEEGHNLVGTFALLTNPAGRIDNRVLAPLFGLDAQAPYVIEERTSDPALPFTLAWSQHPLFDGVARPYVSTGYASSQTPADRAWNGSDRGAARTLAYSDARHAAILQYCGSGYRAIYATHMPEYESGTDDHQLLYNAIVSGAQPGCRKPR